MEGTLFSFFFKILYIYLRKRERDREGMSEQGRSRGQKNENVRQLCTEHGAQMGVHPSTVRL